MQGPQNHSSGFTLIEILVVLVVVGMLVALATITLGGDSLRRDLDNEVQKLFLLMETVSDQAVVNNTELGLVIEEDQYRFLAYNEQAGTWSPPADRLYRPRALPPWLTVTQYIENNAPRLASNEDQPRPDIVMFSSGEITPFELEFNVDQEEGSADDNYVHRLVSDGVSRVRWIDPGKAPEENR